MIARPKPTLEQQQQMRDTMAWAGAKRMRSWLSLNSNSDVAELRASGVPESQIATLYPVTFYDLVPGIIRAIRADGLSQLGVDVATRKKRAASLLQLQRRLPSEASKEYERDRSEFAQSKAKVQLSKCLKRYIPRREREDLVPLIIEQLWTAHWLIEHFEDTDLGEGQRDWNLIRVTDWILPQFAAAEKVGLAHARL